MATLSQILARREQRANRQRELSKEYHLPLLSFTMNIAGPKKSSPLIRRGFCLGRELLLGQLKRVKARILFSEEMDDETGPEGFYVVDFPPDMLKEIACDIEDGTPLGRLFDMDILSPDGAKLERSTPRNCLICDKPVWECSRSRTHSIEELQARTNELLSTALSVHDAETAVALTVPETLAAL